MKIVIDIPEKIYNDIRTKNEHGIIFNAVKNGTPFPEWIPVTERLPDKNGEYLVTLKQGFATFGLWVGVAENWANVIAWMPLPEPYKAEGSDKE